MKLALVRCFNLVREWWRTMAGALSIPFAFLALFDIPGRLLFGVLAYASLWALVISQNREIAKLKRTTKKLDIALYDSFDELLKQGEAMMRKFLNNETPLPTENEFQQWDRRLIALEISHGRVARQTR
jgi:hypothetical protein